MKWLKALLLVSSLTTVLGLDGYTVPPGSPGFQHGNSTMAVQFDSHSLFIDGKRLFVLSGEFHPWRLPVPELWSDILQKMKVRTICLLYLLANEVIGWRLQRRVDLHTLGTY